MPPDRPAQMTVRFAHIATELPIESLAKLVHVRSLGEFEVEERDGLNKGGGQYFRIFDQTRELVLCWSRNYADPPEDRFKYCLYVLRGPDNLLDQAVEQLSKQGAEVVVE